MLCAFSSEWVHVRHLMVLDRLPHAFWYDPELPEPIEANQEANRAMAKFLGKHLK